MGKLVISFVDPFARLDFLHPCESLFQPGLIILCEEAVRKGEYNGIFPGDVFLHEFLIAAKIPRD